MDTADLTLLKSYKKKAESESDSLNVSANSSSVSNQIERTIISQPTEEHEYNCNHPNAGIALVFNHKYIRGQKPREGTEKDRDDIQQTLSNFGYDVRVFNDLSHATLKDVLVQTAQEDHSNNDCLIVAVMTHGIEGKLYAQDESYPVEHLWHPFLGANCRSLINKPKLFFIQACRGRNLEKPVTYLRPRSNESYLHGLKVFEVKRAKEPSTVMYAIPSTADMVVMYSTFEKYYSFRNVENGSWFIQSLCTVLNDAAAGPALSKQGAELLRLLTAVNRKVAYEYQANSELAVLNQMKSMPNFMSTLTKTFYLRIKSTKS